MSNLILVKHSMPDIIASVPASAWQLSRIGQERCAALACMLGVYLPDHIVASREPKAIETASIIAALLNKRHTVNDGLHEHDRAGVAWLGAGEFEACVARFFAQPDELVFGQETANAARQRFTRAITEILEHYPVDNMVVVAHGTVISLFVEQACGVDAFDLWKRLGLPSFVVLARPDFQLITVMEHMEQAGERGW